MFEYDIWPLIQIIQQPGHWCKMGWFSGTVFWRQVYVHQSKIHLQVIFKSQSTRGSKIFGNGQKQPYLKLCLLKASHEQVIKSTLFCLLILMWSRDRQFKFDPHGSNFGAKHFPKFTNFACLLTKQTRANHKSNDVSLLNWPYSL